MVNITEMCFTHAVPSDDPDTGGNALGHMPDVKASHKTQSEKEQALGVAPQGGCGVTVVTTAQHQVKHLWRADLGMCKLPFTEAIGSNQCNTSRILRSFTVGKNST